MDPMDPREDPHLLKPARAHLSKSAPATPLSTATPSRCSTPDTTPEKPYKVQFLELPQTHWAESTTSIVDDTIHEEVHHHHHHHHHHHRKRSSFLHLHVPDTSSWNIMGLHPHWSLPLFSVSPDPDGGESEDNISIDKPGFGRRFSFGLGLRRQSNTALPGSDLMVSFSHRTLVNYIRDDNLQGLQGFLENKRAAVVDDRDENGATALHVAAAKGKLQFARELISHGADVNAEDADQWVPLLCAAKEGHADMCAELLDNGAELEHKDMGGWTALMWASYKGREQVVDLLLERGADVNACGNFHIPSLLWAAGRGHTNIALKLIHHGAKVNFGDKYGTTALVWASRRGDVAVVRALLNSGANVDTAGMYSWTPLLVATMGNHLEVVTLLLEHKPNVNALDKDGCTALTIASKEGYLDIVHALLNYGAYINIQDRTGDTTLIHAVKGGHRGVVEALLKKYADVDIPGKEKKTATYTAVEKGHIPILKLLLSANPDLEVQTKDGDTALLRAVRSRNAEAVQLLLDKKAKVNAADKRGDTALHIAMRARSKAVVEVLLRNPKHSQLLYRPNRAGETPYNIDMSHDKTILGQIFGARRLNTNEDNENMLGYDLYSSALADILSEPSLSMPITVGLYAKWGSGKSFLLNKLRVKKCNFLTDEVGRKLKRMDFDFDVLIVHPEEMHNFARQWVDPVFQLSWLLFVVISHSSLVLGLLVGLLTSSWLVGLSVGLASFFLAYCFSLLVWYSGKRYDWRWLYVFNLYISKKMDSLKLVFQIMFCHPPGVHCDDVMAANPIRFYFTDQTRVSSTTGGESSVVQMLGSLHDSIEKDFGGIQTRLYRAFRPKAVKSSSSWRWRKLCCLPYVVLFEVMLLAILGGSAVLTMYLQQAPQIDKVVAEIILITIALMVCMAVVSNLYTWGRMFSSVVSSQRRHLQRAITKIETLRSEGFLEAVRSEVTFMTEMVKCLDSFRLQQSRLVVVVDGLDSCEQDKVLLVLDTVHQLFSDSGSPYIVILAIDPHVISKAVELSSRRLFTESNIGAHDYLRNMVHLPFYLQNSGLRNVKVAQSTAMHHRKSQPGFESSDDGYLVSHQASRRLSTESGMSSNERLKVVSKKGSRKLKLSESVASSLGSNLNRIGGAHDLTKMLLTDDYFSDVTPRSMRRLMNVVYITGRLLKAFQIDFNWYHLANWVNITEQWPFRTSWIILYYDMMEEALDDNTSLKTLYDKVRPQIPMSKDVVPLLELDRDEKKFDVFLTMHRNNLLVSDLKIFLPFTINLDPYLKKVIKEEQQNAEEVNNIITLYPPTMPNTNGANQPVAMMQSNQAWPPTGKPPTGLKKDTAISDTCPYLRPFIRSSTVQGSPSHMYNPNSMMTWQQPWMGMQGMPITAMYPRLPTSSLSPDIIDTKLSELTVDGVCQLFSKIPDINSNQVATYTALIRDNNINGRVLLHCDLDELKKVLKMSFGDWELFRMLTVAMREHEFISFSQSDDAIAKNVRFIVPSIQTPAPVVERERRASTTKMAPIEKETLPMRPKPSIMEKQVTLEEQMICGALQTLNEEACEDVLDESGDKSGIAAASFVDQEQLSTSVPRPRGRVRSISQCSGSGSTDGGREETDVIVLQSSPTHPFHWQAVALSSSRDANLDSISSSPAINLETLSTSSGPPPQRAGSHGCLTAHITNSSTDPPRPSSLVVVEDLGPYRKQSQPQPISRRKKSRDETLALAPSASLEMLNRLKEKIMRVVPRSGPDVVLSIEPSRVDSDDESTPLVSELPSPTVTRQVRAPVVLGRPDFANGGFGEACSSDGSRASPLGSPLAGVLSDEDTELSLGSPRSTPSHLSRQDALDNRLDDDWANPETSV